MNDFEQVRKGLQFYPEFDEDMQAADEALAALAHIEAEVEQLREEKRVLAENETWAQAEVERLRVLVKAAYGTLPAEEKEIKAAQPELEIEGNTVQGKA